MENRQKRINYGQIDPKSLHGRNSHGNSPGKKEEERKSTIKRRQKRVKKRASLGKKEGR